MLRVRLCGPPERLQHPELLQHEAHVPGGRPGLRLRQEHPDARVPAEDVVSGGEIRCEVRLRGVITRREGSRLQRPRRLVKIINGRFETPTTPPNAKKCETIIVPPRRGPEVQHPFGLLVRERAEAGEPDLKLSDNSQIIESIEDHMEH